jgi:hypothetical protein
MSNITKLNFYTKGKSIIRGNFLVSTDDPKDCLTTSDIAVRQNDFIEEEVYIPRIGINTTYLGFGGSTGSLTNEHWLHDFSWSSSLDSISFSQLKADSNYLNSATIVGDSIRFTQASGGQTGNVFYKTPVKFLDRRNKLLNWSAYYVFSMGGGSKADGLSFILQSTSETAGSIGGGIGYGGIGYSIGIGYDSYYNYQFDPDANHIELDVNGDVSASLQTYTPAFNMCGTTGTNKYIYNWVDYRSGVLYIYISTTDEKPSSPVITQQINVEDYLVNPNLFTF